MNIYIGIDTSNYTTSIAAFDENKNLIADERALLPVPLGKLGLRQSDALFLHIKAFPALLATVMQKVGNDNIACISISTKPRDTEDSYMPVFLAGKAFGETLGFPSKANIKYFSHQEGHIAAGLWSADCLGLSEFIAVHLSGGTTEILRVTKNTGKYYAQIIGKGLDINAGQLVDRIGVMLGMGFPCGRELDSLAKTSENVIDYPVSVNGVDINFSGVETHFKRAIDNKIEGAVIARSLFCAIADALIKAIKQAVRDTGIKNVLMVGGVATNSIIRARLLAEFEAISFAKPEFSTDNAVGIALLGI